MPSGHEEHRRTSERPILSGHPDQPPTPIPADKPEDIIRRAAQEITRLRQRPLLVWCETQGSIDYECVLRLRQIFSDVAPVPELDVLIQSGGGDIHHAYRCLRILRRSATKITALIPFWCKSAATFVVLGTDEKLFGVDGELGPLDTQMGDPSGSTVERSALEEFRSLDYIRNHAMETLNMLFLFMRRHMDVPFALDRAQGSIGEFVTPLYHAVRSQNLGQYYRYLTIAEEYGTRVMRRWGYAGRSEEEISTMVKHLVWDYPAHEFVIDLQEAQEMNLNAKAMNSELDRLCTDVIRPGLPLFELFPLNQMARPEIVPVARPEVAPAAQEVETARVEGGGPHGRGETGVPAAAD